MRMHTFLKLNLVCLGLIGLVLPLQVFAEEAMVVDNDVKVIVSEQPELSEISQPVTASPTSNEIIHEKPITLETTVVTASSMAMSLTEVASAVTVITTEMIEARKAQDLKEILQGVVGIDLAQNGGVGQLSSLFIRGASSERTLVMINGVPMNDSMSPSRNTDISRINLDNVEQIEIVRGPQSVVFGSSAMGGVVNIITKQGTKQPTLSITGEGGKYGSWLGKIQAGGTFAGIEASLGASLEGSESFSAAKRREDFVATQPVPDMENDPYRNLNIDLNLGYSGISRLVINLMNRLSRSRAEVDAYAGEYGDDPNFISNYTQSSNRLDMTYDVLPNLWKTRVSAGIAQLDRVINDDLDENHPFSMTRSEYRSRNVELTWHNQVDFLQGNHLSVGVDYQQEQGMSNYYSEYLDWFTFMPTTSSNNFEVRSMHHVGVYLEDQYTWEGLIVNAGVRYDEHDQYGGHTTYRITPSYRYADWGTRVKATYGTAFNSPALYQLYVEDIFSQGDPTLKPETSVGWDAGIEQRLWEDKLFMSVTYFKTTYHDQISSDYDMSTYKYIYENLESSETKGWEVEVRAEPIDQLICKIAYTKLIANDLTHEDTIGPVPLLRRAQYQFSADLQYTYETVSVAVHVGHVGPRWDIGKKDLEPYTLIDMIVRYQIMPQAQVYLKLRNLLDEAYMEIDGYDTARFGAYAGIKVDLF